MISFMISNVRDLAYFNEVSCHLTEETEDKHDKQVHEINISRKYTGIKQK
jgi:hypothetical protein